jgi:hypothetical protein
MCWRRNRQTGTQQGMGQMYAAQDNMAHAEVFNSEFHCAIHTGRGAVS